MVLRWVLFLGVLCASAHAQGVTAVPVEDLRTAGQIHLRMGRLQEALTALLAAYEAEPDPELLLPIARCHAELRDWDKAAFFAEEYLHSPDAAAREAAEELLAEAKSEIVREREMERLTRLLGEPDEISHPAIAGSTTGAQLALVSTSASSAVPAQALPPPAASGPGAAGGGAGTARSTSLSRRWWLLCGAGVLAIAAGGAVAASSSSHERKTLPEGDLGTIDRREP